MGLGALNPPKAADHREAVPGGLGVEEDDRDRCGNAGEQGKEHRLAASVHVHGTHAVELQLEEYIIVRCTLIPFLCLSHSRNGHR